jgi:hypothetical protein
MDNREWFERLVRERLADVPLTPEDREAVRAQAERALAVLRTLDELPLHDLEPAVICRLGA